MAEYNYADRFESQLAQKYERELVSYELTQSNQGIKFINAQTIKLPKMTVSGYKDWKWHGEGCKGGESC